MLSATNDENGDELNGETDDEDMEDGEMGFDDGSAQVRNTRDPGQPTATDAQDDLEGVPHVSMDYGFLGEKESEDRVSPVLVVQERRHKMMWAMLVQRKRTEFFLDRNESSEVHR